MMETGLRLQLFGAGGLYSAAGAAIALQPKRIALLAYVALAGKGTGVEREMARALLWPELDASAGRNALNQAVHGVRRATGPDAFVSEGSLLLLDPAHVGCDVWELDDSIARGDVDAMLEVHGSRLLDGFHLDDAEPFHDWLQHARAECVRRSAEEVWRAAESGMRRDRGDGVQLAHRALGLQGRDSELAVRRFMNVVASAGDITLAINEYERLCSVLAEDGLLPSAETVELARSLRTDSATTSRDRIVMRRFAAAAVLVLLVGAVAMRTTLATRMGRSADQRRLAAETESILRTTSSEPARQYYLEGEEHFRAGRFGAAAQSFALATREDSTFGGAWYRLSRAANWSGQDKIAVAAATNAVRFSAGVADVRRLLLEAWEHQLNGRVADAEPLYAGVLALDSMNQDAQGELADIQYHWGSFIGRPAVDTRQQWEHLLSLEPANAEILRHLVRVLAMQRDAAAFAKAASRLESLRPSSDALLEIATIRAFMFGDSASRSQVLAQLAAIDNPMRRALIRPTIVAGYDDRVVADQLGSMLLYGHTYATWELGEVLIRAQMYISANEIPHGLALIDSAQTLGTRARAFRYQVMLVPGVNDSRDTLVKALRELQRDPVDPTDLFAAPWRLYHIGSIAARLGMYAVAGDAASQLERYTDTRDDAPNFIAQSRIYARIVRAELLSSQGRTSEALLVLGDPMLPPDLRLPHIWTFPRAHERFLRATLLDALGRHEEAQRWYRTFPDPSSYDVMWTLAVPRR